MQNVAKENLFQIKHLLANITVSEYVNKIEALLGASIGEHVRHILEFYVILISGVHTATICYDNRERDPRIEEDPAFASDTIDRILSALEALDLHLSVRLEADYSKTGYSVETIPSSIFRELAYCIEHSVHHQALIKTGLYAMGLSELTEEHFGVAFSTLRYRNQSCVQ